MQYLNNICIIASDINDVLDRIKLVFSCLKEFHLKIKPKQCYYFQASMNFIGHVLSADGIFANQEKVDIIRLTGS